MAHFRCPGVPDPISTLVDLSVEEIDEGVEEHVHDTDPDKGPISALVYRCR